MWFSMIVKFLATHWRTIAVAVVAGVIISGVATLWGAYKIEKGTRIGLEAELEAANVRQEMVEASLGSCVEANAQWQSVVEEWRKQLDAFEESQHRYMRAIEALKAQRDQIAAENNNLLAKIDSINATDCTGAVNQLIAALEWGAE